MVRLNNDGSVDNTFKIGTGADDRIWNVFKDYNPDGSWAGTWTVTGAFQSFNGQPRQCLASLDRRRQSPHPVRHVHHRFRAI